jgi:phosphoribosylformylglycinamidine synthase subunit PurL
MISPETIAQHGLTNDEYARIERTLGRAPTLPELGVFSVMWSEHCSYKSSRVHLRRFPTTGPRVLIGPGENAGAVDIGNGLAAVFKMESHNHPSQIEPYQGAATGVGGILRDVFTMGARPIALLDSLRFGRWDAPRTKELVRGVVHGIGGYGNCMGIPTVGGETRFHESYDQNCLVNAFCLGVVRQDRIFLGRAAGVGNPIYYVGARTGRDGIHGATMASESFDEGTDEKRPTVQVGDPFFEKLLLEACLELMERGCIVGIQDMGAAGLTSSSVEMAGRGGAGLVLELAQVPLRETGLTPYEILLSESQERMLVVIEEGRDADVGEVFEKWDLTWSRIGTVTDDGIWRCRFHGEEVAAIPVKALTDQAPVYERPMQRPSWQDGVQRLDSIPALGDANAALLALLRSPDICDKTWIWRQYDTEVGTSTVVRPGADAALMRVDGTSSALALATDCNARHVFLDPRRGACGQVAESARNLACVGAEAVGLTDCLNFGSPERPEVMWQFSEAIDGISEACKALGIPVVSGNVSFYNESDVEGAKSAIHPTPSVALVGLVPDASVPPPGSRFPSAGLEVALLGLAEGTHLGGSAYLSVVHGVERGLPPAVDLAAERALHDRVRTLVRSGVLEACHDASDGGLAVALAEMCMDGIGAALELPGTGGLDARLFGEDHGRVLVAYRPENRGKVGGQILGRTGGDRLRLGPIDIGVDAMRDAWFRTFESWLA